MVRHKARPTVVRALLPVALAGCGALANRSLDLAAKAGDVTRARRALEARADVNGRDAQGRTALQTAVDSGARDIVRLLLDGGADPNAGEGETPLQMAIRRGSHGTVKLLIARGADTNAGQGERPLQMALRRRSPDIVRLLLERGADANVREGQAPLQIASASSSPDIVRLLIEKGADPNAGEGRPPLQIALGRGRLDIMRLLLEKGASVVPGLDLLWEYFPGPPYSPRRSGQKRPPDFAAVLTTVLQNAKGHPIPPSALCSAAAQNDPHLVELLVWFGADVSGTDKHNQSALAVAVRHGAWQAARYLLGKGGNADQTFGKGTTAAVRTALNEGSLPGAPGLLEGGRTITIINPTSTCVVAAVYSCQGNELGSERDLVFVPSNGRGIVTAPEGRYRPYFVYASDPKAVYQGEDFSLWWPVAGVEIRLVKVVDGNYRIWRSAPRRDPRPATVPPLALPGHSL